MWKCLHPALFYLQGSASSTASNGGQAISVALGQADGGEVNVVANSKAVDGETAEAIAQATAENGKKAEAIASAIGSGEGISRSWIAVLILGFLQSSNLACCVLEGALYLFLSPVKNL